MTTDTKSLCRVQNHLKSLYRESRQHTRDGRRSWHYVARKEGLSVGTIIRIVKDGYEPKSPTIRRALGLPIYVRVLACAMCGQMHLNPSKICPTRNRVNRQIRMPIAELPARVLAWKLRNREEMPDAD